MNKETEKILGLLEKEDEMKNGDEKSELEELRAEKKVKENLSKELEVLLRIYPELSPDEIPEEVFDKTEMGKGLAGEYLVYKALLDLKKAEEEKKDEENSSSAPPEVKDIAEDAFFTYDKVKNMSRDEIRKNYKNIIKSMEKWK